VFFIKFTNVNYLAHIYLSGDDDYIKIGNFIADRVKGKEYLNYQTEIQYGILLHRQIDSFTDKHPIVKRSKSRLHERYRHYDGVIIDILYDHFLAKNWKNYSEIPLKNYVQHFYSLLESNYKLLPEKIQYLYPFMFSGNWLYNYKTIDGIGKVLTGMNRRSGYKSHMHLAVEDLQLNYEEFENDFTIFFRILRTFSHEKLQTLMT